MKKLLIILSLLVLILSGCSSLNNKMEKMGKGMSSSDYIVVLYSGGEVVKWWLVEDKIVNTEESSDGYFWIGDDDMLRRVNGDVVIEEIKGRNIDEVKNEYGLK